MKLIVKLLLAFLFLGIFLSLSAQIKKGTNAIYSGIPWYDEQGNTVSAHGACIVKENDRYYLFGERHKDETNEFVGFNCYSSTDLYNWRWERIALPQQPNGKLGPNRVGERPKVLKCPSTGEYIMFMHVDTMGYNDQFVGYATSTHVIGPYTFQGPILFNSKPIKKWDIGAFQDIDGSEYILLHGGDIYKLSDDYKSISEQKNKAFERGFESPVIFHKDSLYFFLGSDLTGWERNDNYYFTATSLQGLWEKRGFIAPEGTLTWNSQATFVLPIVGLNQTSFMYMGDRWSFPKQNSAATYVWQPLLIEGHSISMPVFHEGWAFDTKKGVVLANVQKVKTIEALDNKIVYHGNWNHDTLSVKSSNEKDASFSLTTQVTQIGLYGLARPDGGYASVVIQNSKGETVLNSNIDFYSKYPIVLLKFLSPVLEKDKYTITIKVLDESWWWKEKSGRLSGSKGTYVSLKKLIVKK